MSTTYSNLLRDSRWQQKRLQIMQQDGWRCRGCGCNGGTLNVHHIRYGAKPWLVPDNALQTLCEVCHENLGPHPKGGVYYSEMFKISYLFCPICKSLEIAGGECCQCGALLSSMGVWRRGVSA